LKTLDDQRVFEIPASGRIDDLAYPSDKDLVLIQYKNTDYDFQFESITLQTLFNLRSGENISSEELKNITASDEQKTKILADFEKYKNKFILGLLNLYNSFIRNPQMVSSKSPNTTQQIKSLKYIVLPILIGENQNYVEFLIYNTETKDIISGRTNECMIIDDIFCKITSTGSKIENRKYAIFQYCMRFNYNKKNYQGYNQTGDEPFDTADEYKYIFEINTIENVECNAKPPRPALRTMIGESARYHLGQLGLNGGSLLKKSRKTQKRNRKPSKTHIRRLYKTDYR